MQADSRWDINDFGANLAELHALSRELPGVAPYEVADTSNVWDRGCNLQIATSESRPGTGMLHTARAKNQIARFIALAMTMMPEILARWEAAEIKAAKVTTPSVWIVRWHKTIKPTVATAPTHRGDTVVITDTAPKAWEALRKHVHDTMFNDVPDQYDVIFSPDVLAGVWVTMVLAPSDVSRAALMLREPLAEHEARGMKALAAKRNPVPPAPAPTPRPALYDDPCTDCELDEVD